jgi:hypothetical protein
MPTGIEVDTIGDTYEGQQVSVSPAYPSPPGTTRYRVVPSIIAPPAGGYTSHMKATALAPDYYDPGDMPSDTFTVTVVPLVVPTD